MPINFTFGGQTAFENLSHLLLQKNDGSYWLAVWSDVSEWNPANTGSLGSYPLPAPTSIVNSLNFLGTYIAQITEYKEDPAGEMMSNEIPVINGTTAQIAVGARPTIYRIRRGNAPIPVPAPSIANPAAHWSMDEGHGTVAANSVDATADLSFPSNAQEIGWLSGRYRAGLGFNGTQATTNKATIDTSRSYSATAWVQLNSLTGYQAAVAVNGIEQAAFALDYTPQSRLSYTVYSNDGVATETRIGSSIVPIVGNWYAVAGTYNGLTRKMSFYVNGRLQSTAIAQRVFRGIGGTEIGSIKAANIGVKCRSTLTAACKAPLSLSGFLGELVVQK